MGGTIDLAGGRGGTYSTSDPSGTFRGVSVGGDGASGFLRVESRGTVNLGSVVGQPSTAGQTGMLADFEMRSVARSRWYTLPATAMRTLEFYEIDAVVDGVPRVFTDNPANPNLANVPGAPVRILFQGADVDPSTLMPLNAPTVWVDELAELAPANPTGFRFIVLFDLTTAGTVFIEEFRLAYSG